MTLLNVRDVSKMFGGVRALHSVSFSVEEGTVCSVIGPNGAGKTTLFNLITGLYQPSSGSIRINGDVIGNESPHVLARRGMSRTFQNLQIFFNMTALENVMVGAHRHLDGRFLPALFSTAAIRRSEQRCRDEAAALLQRLGLQDWGDQDASAMPYGALKRLEIARALATQPRLLLLDEPAAGLNETETQAMQELISLIAADGVTILLIEHHMRMVMAVSDRIIVLDHGSKLAEGTPNEIQANPAVAAAYLGTVEEAV